MTDARGLAIKVVVDTKGVSAALSSVDSQLTRTTQKMKALATASRQASAAMKQVNMQSIMAGTSASLDMMRGRLGGRMNPTARAALEKQVLATERALLLTMRQEDMTKRSQLLTERTISKEKTKQLMLQEEIASATRRTTAASRGGAGAGGGTRPGDQAKGGMGVSGLGLFAIFAGAGALGAGFRGAAELERGAIRASFASQGNQFGAGRFQEEILGSSRFLQTGVGESATFIREIQQLGLSNQSQVAALARGAGLFSMVNPEIGGQDAAEAFYRLFVSTSRRSAFGTGTTKDLNFLIDNTMKFASAVQVAGDMTAAGAEQVFDMMRNIQQTGQFADFGPLGVVAISGALADLNSRQQEMFRTAILRLFTKGFRENAGAFAEFLGLDSAEAFNEMRRNDPMGLLLRLNQAFQEVPESERIDLGPRLGTKNARDLILLGTLGASKIQSIWASLNDTFGDTVPLIQEMSDSIRFSLSGAANELGAAFSRLGATVTLGLDVPLKSFMFTMSGVIEMFERSPFLRALAIGGITMGVGRVAHRAIEPTARFLFGQRASRGPGIASTAYGRFVGGGRYAAAGMGLDVMTLMALGLPVRTVGKLAGGALGGLLGRGVGAKRAALARAGMAGMGGGRFAQMFAGGMGRIGMGGVLQRLSGFGVRGMVGGPVGIMVAAVTMLEPVFTKLGALFDELGDKGGLLGLVLETVGAGFKLLSKVGQGINKLFDIVFGTWLRPIWDFINNNAERARVAIFGPGGRDAQQQATLEQNYNVTLGSESGFSDFVGVSNAQAATGLPATGSTGV